jgi:hypothetical protein
VTGISVPSLPADLRQARLAIFDGGEQRALFPPRGSGRVRLRLVALGDAAEPAPPGEAPWAPGLDQLSFGPTQAVLPEAAPPPCQLALLPDPPPWELPAPPLRRPRRRSAGRRRAMSPGQLALL